MRQISTEALLNRKDTMLSYCKVDNPPERIDCPWCGQRMTYWQIMAFNGDGDFLENLEAYRCFECKYEIFSE